MRTDFFELYEQTHQVHWKPLAGIQLLALDFDGTLTEDDVWVLPDGSEAIRAHRGDGYGLELLDKHTNLKKSEGRIVILSRESNPICMARAEKLGIPCTNGLETKLDSLYEAAAAVGVGIDRVCYIGNDLNDKDCIEIAGVGVAVGNAHEVVKQYADIILQNEGGRGAVRELCEYILLAKGAHPHQDLL